MEEINRIRRANEEKIKEREREMAERSGRKKNLIEEHRLEDLHLERASFPLSKQEAVKGRQVQTYFEVDMGVTVDWKMKT